MSEDSRQPMLSERTGIPLSWILWVAGAAVTAIIFAIGVTVTFMGKLNSIENAIASQRMAIALMEANSSDRWTVGNMDSWIDKTRLRNAGLILPSVTEVKPTR